MRHCGSTASREAVSRALVRHLGCLLERSNMAAIAAAVIVHGCTFAGSGEPFTCFERQAGQRECGMDAKGKICVGKGLRFNK